MPWPRSLPQHFTLLPIFYPLHEHVYTLAYNNYGECQGYPSGGNLSLGNCQVPKVPINCQATAKPRRKPLLLVRISSLNNVDRRKNWIRRENSA